MKNVSQETLSDAASHFCILGQVLSITPYGNGHINGTYLLVTDAKRYILQVLNTDVFKKPEKVMQNIEKVTDFLKQKESDSRRVLTLVRTTENTSFYNDDEGNFFRIYDFIEDSICPERPESTEDFYQCAVCFGNFQRDLHTFPAETLFETIPDFHNTEKRFSDFLMAVKEDKVGRAASAKKEIEFITRRKNFYSVLLDANKHGDLPLRVTHNDTKCNNVMLDATTRQGLCVIDLDTIMPGFSVTDFGDSIRFGASTAAEDEKDLSKVHLDLKMFTAYAKGFIRGCGGLLTDTEVLLLPEGAKMMTIECGMRFLADYLNGDTYFKTPYPEHNLVRCRTQLKLVEAMEQHWTEMKNIVREEVLD